MKQTLSSSPSSDQQVEKAFEGLEITMSTLNQKEALQQVIDTATSRLAEEEIGGGDEIKRAVTDQLFTKIGELLQFEESQGGDNLSMGRSGKSFMILTESGSIMLCVQIPNIKSCNIRYLTEHHEAASRQADSYLFTDLKIGKEAVAINSTSKIGQTTERDKDWITTSPVVRILASRDSATMSPQKDDEERLMRTSIGDSRALLAGAVFGTADIAMPSMPDIDDSGEIELSWNPPVILPPAREEVITSSTGAEAVMAQIRENRPNLSEQSTDQAFRIQSPSGPAAAELDPATELHLPVMRVGPDGRLMQVALNGGKTSEAHTKLLDTSALLGTAGEHPAQQPGGYPDLNCERFDLGQLKTALLAARQVAARQGDSSTLATQLLASQPDLRIPSPLAPPPPDGESEALTRLADVGDMLEPQAQQQGVWTRLKRWLGLK